MNVITPKYDINSYFCTWSSQSDLRKIYTRRFENGVFSTRDMLNEETVFGEGGLIHQFPEIRDRLIFLLDDGWDVPYGLTNNANGDFGSLIVNEARFPFCIGEPRERLKILSDRIKSHGWKGAGIWICASGKGEKNDSIFSMEEREKYWRERLAWSQYAQIAYWKVDWGVLCWDVAFRRQLNQWKDEIYPELIIEHANPCAPLSGIDRNSHSPDESGRFGDWGKAPQTVCRLADFSDVIRTYDVSPTLSVPTTLDRVQYLLRAGTATGSQAYMNAEDEAYICAALSLEIGVMTNQLRGDDGTLLRKNAAEAIRAVNWLTAFAPPYPIGVGEVETTNEVLIDTCNFAGKDTWVQNYGDREIPQGAPAFMGRNMPLPQAEYLSGEKPYIIAGRHPNGAQAIAVLPRYRENWGFFVPPVKIQLAHSTNNPLGIFGILEELTLVLEQPLAEKRIFVQDLAGDSATDITEECSVNGNSIQIRGNLLARLGTLANTQGEQSMPGLVLKVL